LQQFQQKRGYKSFSNNTAHLKDLKDLK